MYSHCLCMTTLTEVFSYFFLSCKANARVKPAKTGHGPHSSNFCVVLCIFCVVLCIVCLVTFFVLFCVYMCTELLPSGGYQIAVKYIISYYITYIISYHTSYIIYYYNLHTHFSKVVFLFTYPNSLLSVFLISLQTSLHFLG